VVVELHEWPLVLVLAVVVVEYERRVVVELVLEEDVPLDSVRKSSYLQDEKKNYRPTSLIITGPGAGGAGGL